MGVSVPEKSMAPSTSLVRSAPEPPTGVAPADGQRGQGDHAQGAQGAATGQEHRLSSLSQRGSEVQSDTG